MIACADMEVLIMGQRLQREDRRTVTRLMVAMGLEASEKDNDLIGQALDLEGLDQGLVSAWLSVDESQER